MSKFTTEVRFICESKCGLPHSKGFTDVDSILDNSVLQIFNFSFPIFDEAYRVPLEKKILRHYYTREISEETVGLWQLRLCQKLNEIMPYYNKLYESELLQFDPLNDIDLTTQHQKVDNGQSSRDITNDETSTGHKEYVDSSIRNVTDNDTIQQEHGDTTTLTNSHSDTDTLSSTLRNTHNDSNNENSWDVYSDTPQGALTNVNNNTYLTNARKITKDGTNQGNYTDTTTSTNTNSGNYTNRTNNSGNIEETKQKKIKDTNDLRHTANENGTKDATINEEATNRNTEDYLQKIIGKTANKTYSKMVQEFRETFLNIDAMIIKDLSVCFFGLWE